VSPFTADKAFIFALLSLRSWHYAVHRIVKQALSPPAFFGRRG